MQFFLEVPQNFFRLNWEFLWIDEDGFNLLVLVVVFFCWQNILFAIIKFISLCELSYEFCCWIFDLCYIAISLPERKLSREHNVLCSPLYPRLLFILRYHSSENNTARSQATVPLFMILYYWTHTKEFDIFHINAGFLQLYFLPLVIFQKW